MQEQDEIHNERNWVATVATFIVLLLVSLFLWRVVYYVNLIQSGSIDKSSPQLVGSFTSSLRLASEQIPEGEFDVVTVDDPFLGAENSKLTIVEFADFGCPYSQASSLIMRKLSTENPDKIRYIYRDFPLIEIHPLAQKASEASHCAKDQNKFWEYHDKLYQNQNDLSQKRLYQFAQELGLNSGRFKSCLDSDKYKDEVKKDFDDGVRAGVRGTPTFFINGNRIPGVIPEKVLNELLAAVALSEYVP